jgi:predicted O-methyltransferase YrrM
MKLRKIFIVMLVLLSRLDSNELYDSINLLPFDPQGWFVNADPLVEICETLQPEIVIEVGSWLGASTRFIAQIMPKEGKLYAVDTWLGSDEETHKKDPRLNRIYQIFLSNVVHAGLQEKIIPVRMTSMEAAEALNIKADLIYIDASHKTQDVYNDIIAWSKHLNSDGVICGDDWNWKSVRIAVNKASIELKQQIISEGNFWRLKPL